MQLKSGDIEMLAQDEALLRAGVGDLEADNRALRELLHLSLDRVRLSVQREQRNLRRIRELTATAHRSRQAA